MDLMAVLFCLVAIAFLGGAVCIVRNNPPKSSSRLINATIAITALALLIFFNIPWAEIAFNRFSSEEKDNLARKHFDPAYGLARRSIESCRYFKNYIGGLSSLDISCRESFVRQTGDRTHGFFDFDYVGSDNAGRLTVGFSFKESTQDGPTPSYELVAPYAEETPREVRVLVYASGASQHYEVNCPWFNQDK
jgi:hypothetical protein